METTNSLFSSLKKAEIFLYKKLCQVYTYLRHYYCYEDGIDPYIRFFGVTSFLYFNRCSTRTHWLTCEFLCLILLYNISVIRLLSTVHIADRIKLISVLKNLKNSISFSHLKKCLKKTVNRSSDSRIRQRLRKLCHCWNSTKCNTESSR